MLQYISIATTGNIGLCTGGILTFMLESAYTAIELAVVAE
jgi:hypothetical protein